MPWHRLRVGDGYPEEVRQPGGARRGVPQIHSSELPVALYGVIGNRASMYSSDAPRQMLSRAPVQIRSHTQGAGGRVRLRGLFCKDRSHSAIARLRGPQQRRKPSDSGHVMFTATSPTTFRYTTEENSRSGRGLGREQSTGSAHSSIHWPARGSLPWY